jgi:hypothetical protein
LKTLNRAHARGTAAGAFILSAFGGAWVLVALANWEARPVWASGAAGAVLGLLEVLAVARFVSAGRLPDVEDAKAAAEGRRTGMWFGIIFSLECALIALGAVLLSRSGLALWIPSLAALVVGLHFFPLARLFGVPLYFATGAGTVACVLLTAFLREPSMRLLLLGLSVGAVLWASSALALYQVRAASAPAA